jgi:hypothetical protein
MYIYLRVQIGNHAKTNYINVSDALICDNCHKSLYSINDQTYSKA